MILLLCIHHVKLKLVFLYPRYDDTPKGPWGSYTTKVEVRHPEGIIRAIILS